MVLALFLCCKLPWQKTCSKYFKNRHGPSAPMISNPTQPRALTSALDNGTEIIHPPPHPALRFNCATATNHAGLGRYTSTDQLWTYQKAPPQAHGRWNKFKKTRDRYAISDFQMPIGITYVIFFAILLMLALIFGAIFVKASIPPPPPQRDKGRCSIPMLNVRM